MTVIFETFDSPKHCEPLLIDDLVVFFQELAGIVLIDDPVVCVKN